MPLAAAQMARYFDRWVRQYGQPLTVYAQSTVVTDGIAGASSYAKVGTVTGMVQITQKAQDRAAMLGVVQSRAVIVYVLSDEGALMKDRSVLVDVQGTAWLIRHDGNQQMAGPAPENVVGIGFLATFMPTKPPGVV